MEDAKVNNKTGQTTLVALTGNEAVATAMRQINPDVVAAYPITPQTSLMQKFADFAAAGLVDTEIILVESEHSAMSACVGSAAAGVRTMTATSANGLALMWEIVYIAASSRLPIVMPVVNRALSGPINIHCDHSDTMGCRDSSWIQIYSENSQEAYDNTIQAIRIAEHANVLLPVMVTLDGFIISHSIESVHVYEDAKVKEFIGEYKPHNPLLDLNNPVTFGPLDLYDYYFEHKRQQSEAMKNSKRVIEDIGRLFGQTFGTVYDLIETYRLEDADECIVVLGSTAGTAKEVVDALRGQGRKVGLLKIRVFRPFPETEIIDALRGVKVVGVLDRSEGFSAVGGPVYQEIRAALCARHDISIVNYIYGLGGRDIGIADITKVFDELSAIRKAEKPITSRVDYVGVRE
ncbi:MAG: pyruvate ferredoxin oxidoreductase [Candidatus Omnitrophica bacterium]|nr:pyruvate ferredoxin oxidoreductase [Candidatus Omnitrophota bacterium]